MSRSPRRSRSSSIDAKSIPAARSTAEPSRRASRPSSSASSPGPHNASTALARFMISLRYFQRMIVGARDRFERRAARARPRPSRATSSTPVGIAADVEQPADRRRRRGDHTGLEMLGGQHHADPVHVREPPQRDALVLDAVLHAHDGNVGSGRGRERVERAGRVLRLHRRRARRRRRASRSRAGSSTTGTGNVTSRSGSTSRSPSVAHRCEVRAARDRDDVVPVLEQAAGDHAADRAGAEDDDAHQSRSVPFAASMYAGFSPPPCTSMSAPFT